MICKKYDMSPNLRLCKVSSYQYDNNIMVNHMCLYMCVRVRTDYVQSILHNTVEPL